MTREAPPSELGATAGTAPAELQRTVGLLLTTQQALIDLRHKRDREQRVLDGIVRFSERVLPAASEPAFWESVVDAGTETFECESCLAVELVGDGVVLLAARGPRPCSAHELGIAGRLIADSLRRRLSFVEEAELAGLSFAGGGVATVMLAPIHRAEGGPSRALVASVSTRKKPFFPTFDALCVPGLRMFASHVDVLHQMLRTRQRIAGQVTELDRSNAALAEANRNLEQRMEERLRAEAAVRESESKYRQLFEDSADGMALVAVDTLAIVECNTALCVMCHQAPTQLIGERLAGLLVPRAAAAQGQGRYEADLLVLEESLRVPNAPPVPVEIRVSRLRADGRDYDLCMFRDLSYRQRAEAEQEALRAQLAQAQRMESIGRLAGGVAHDFNNLLTVISGNTDMLLEAPDLSSDSVDLLSEVREGSRRARALTQQLLMFSRKQVIKPLAGDMNRTIVASLRIYRSLIGEDVSLRFDPCEDPTPIFVDEQQFDQLLSNLLINARDAIHQVDAASRRCEIQVSTSVVRQGSPLGGPAVRLVVRDTGIGMDEATLQIIFEPFFTTKGVGQGTGLGLATVLGVVHQNHGRIEVESKVGAGSTFSVYWPLLEAEQAEDAAPSSPPRSPRGTEHVLLVEDDSRVRRLEGRLLRRLGFAVTECDSGESALGVLDQVMPVDILVTDVVMPQMNGRELADVVRRRIPGLPVLFVSGYTDDIVARQGVVREGVSLLEKPFTQAALGTSVRELLDGRGRPR
jgi:PAS domain S-box-containing protein